MILKNHFHLTITVRRYFEAFPQNLEVLPQNLLVCGLISGYRTLRTDPDFQEVFVDVTQGGNEELRIVYSGEH